MHTLLTTLTWLALIGFTLAGWISTIKPQPRLFIADRVHGMWLGLLGLALMFAYGLINGMRAHPHPLTTQYLFAGLLIAMLGMWWVSKPNGILRQQPVGIKWALGVGGYFIIFSLGILASIVIQDTEQAAYLADIQKTDPAAYKAHLAHVQAERQVELVQEQQHAQRQQEAKALEDAKEWEEEYARACRTRESFLAWAEDIMKGKLKSPATAEFAGWNDPAVQYSGFADNDTKECIWTVKSYVDSHNGFGAVVRTKFLAKIRLKRDSQMTMILEDFMAYLQ